MPPPLPVRAKNAPMKRSLLKLFFCTLSRFVLKFRPLNGDFEGKSRKKRGFLHAILKIYNKHKIVFSASNGGREVVFAFSKNSLPQCGKYLDSLGADSLQIERVALDLSKEARIVRFGGTTCSEWH